MVSLRNAYDGTTDMRVADLLSQPPLALPSTSTVDQALARWVGSGAAYALLLDGKRPLAVVEAAALLGRSGDEPVIAHAQEVAVIARTDTRLDEKLIAALLAQKPQVIPVVHADSGALAGVLDGAGVVLGLRAEVRRRDDAAASLFQRIVVPVDFEESSFAALRVVAETYPRADIHVVHVIERTAGAWPGARLGDLDDESRRAAAGRLLGRAVAELGLEVIEATVRVGSPASEICAYASDIKADMVLLASHARGGVRRWAMGSVAEAVVRQAPCPVLVLRRLIALERHEGFMKGGIAAAFVATA